jgi:hypothetical protein
MSPKFRTFKIGRKKKVMFWAMKMSVKKNGIRRNVCFSIVKSTNFAKNLEIFRPNFGHTKLGEIKT